MDIYGLPPERSLPGPLRRRRLFPSSLRRGWRNPWTTPPQQRLSPHPLLIFQYENAFSSRVTIQDIEENF